MNPDAPRTSENDELESARGNMERPNEDAMMIEGLARRRSSGSGNIPSQQVDLRPWIAIFAITAILSFLLGLTTMHCVRR